MAVRDEAQGARSAGTEAYIGKYAEGYEHRATKRFARTTINNQRFLTAPQ